MGHSARLHGDGGRKPPSPRLAAPRLAEAVDRVREALAAMAGSTATTLSGHFEAFAAAVDALIGLSETGIEFGIAGRGEAAPHDPWDAYGAGSPALRHKSERERRPGSHLP